MSLALVTIPNVPLVEVGMDWPSMTGNITITREDLVDAASAAADDPSIPNPRLKLTQVGDTHGDAITEPSFGTVTNLRFNEEDETLYGDFEGVPAWLAEVLPAAYPSRSVEIYWGVKTVAGGTWKAVIGAVQLLGVEWPGCTTLEDLPLYYGRTKPETVVLNFDKINQMATARLKGGMQVDKSSLTVAVEDVRRSYYDTLDAQGNYSWWIKQILLDPNQLVVEDEFEGKLYLVGFSVGSDDQVTFGSPEEVKVQYVPVPQTTAEKKAAASMFAAGIAASGRSVLASYATAEEAGRVVKLKEGGESMNDEQRKALAVKLGLPEDATEEQINAKLQEQALGEATPDPDPDPDPAPDPDPDPDPTPAPEAVGAGAGLTITVDRGQWEQTQRDAALGREAHLTNVRSSATQLVEDAVRDGRIAPASRQAWFAAIFDEKSGRLVDAEVAALKALAAGRIPLEERGINGGGNGDDPAAFSGDAYPKSWFPEVERRRAAMKAAAERGARVFTEVA